jgi:hypothetical protein
MATSRAAGAIWSSFKKGDRQLNRSPRHRVVIGASLFSVVAQACATRAITIAISAREAESGRARSWAPDRSLGGRFGRRLGRESAAPV